MPAKTTERSEALERISVPVGRSGTAGLGGSVMPGGRMSTEEAGRVLVTSSDCTTELVPDCVLLGDLVVDCGTAGEFAVPVGTEKMVVRSTTLEDSMKT